MSRLYDMRELLRGIQHPYLPIHPDYEHLTLEEVRKVKQWDMTECLTQLQTCPSEKWRKGVLNRLRKIGYVIPSYIQHPLIDYLIERRAITRKGEL